MSERAFVDLHSHLVPGVDDGATSMEDALEGIGRMVDRGIGRIVTTPHLEGSLTRDLEALGARLEAVDRAFGCLLEAVAERYPTVALGRGHEVKLDLPDPDLSDPRVRLGESDFVLVEWPRLQIPPETPAALTRLRAQGIHVLIAHPERYRGFGDRLRLAEVWREEGAFLQVNLGSLVGRYGPEPKTLAFRLLERGWVDCLATDFHGRPHLRLYVDESRDLFTKLGADTTWELLTQVNPSRILAGEEPLSVTPLEGGTRWIDRIRSLFRVR